MSIDRREENVIYLNAGVNVIFYPLQHNETKEKKFKKDETLKMRKYKSMSELIKRWSAGDNRPENGSFVGFSLAKKGNYALPEFY